MIEIISQIGQTPPSTAFMLGFSMALAIRRGRIGQVTNGIYSAGSANSTNSEDSADSADSESVPNKSRDTDWEDKQIEG